MTQLLINTGSTPNDKSADSLYSAFNKVNANFTELYDTLGPGGGSALTKEMVEDYTAAMFTNGSHTGISIVYDDSHNVIDLAVDTLVNVDGGSASSIYGQTDMLIDGGGV